MSPGSTPEWLPEELTNKGLVPIAAEPEKAGRDGDRAHRDGDAAGRPRGGVPIDQVERVVRDRLAEIERRLESRLAAAVADLKRAVDGSDRAPALFSALDGNGGDPAGDGVSAALGGEVDDRLRDAERRVARAARATERNVDEVRRILGARLAASRWVGDEADDRHA